MHDITLIFVSVGVIVDSITIGILSKRVRAVEKERIDWHSRWVEEKIRNDKLSEITKMHYENFRNTKSMFLKLRKELIKKQILTKEFEYTDDNEAIEDFIEEFWANQEKKESVNSSNSSESVFSQA